MATVIKNSKGKILPEYPKLVKNEETGKKIWTKHFLDGETVDVQIVYFRHQLRMYDSSLEKFYSTPIYDNSEQVLPLYLDKAVVKRGTEKELQAMFPKLTLKGKPGSKLDKKTILYVLYEGEMYQMNLRGSSMYSWMSYTRKVLPNSVLTRMNSEAKSKGSIDWNQMTFEKVRDLNGKEVEEVLEKVREIKEAVATEKSFYASANAASAKAKEELDKF